MRKFQGQWLLSNQNMKVHLRMWSQKGMQGESLARGVGGGNFDLQHYNKSPSLSSYHVPKPPKPLDEIKIAGQNLLNSYLNM